MMSKLALVLLVMLQAASPWKQAAAGYRFEFPRDHASHPDYKIEWWYYTGNVKTADGARFGYQVTFFRVGVDHQPSNPSRWAIRDLYMTHLAVSDSRGQKYHFTEKLSRGGPGLAGASAEKYYVWNDDWVATLAGSGEPGTGSRKHLLKAMTADFGIDLVLDEGKPPAINGRDGISQKGAQAGNASHYYSMTRMPTTGTIIVNGTREAVSGDSWMDHEFGTTFLEPEQRGWDWLSIQLSDGRDLMLYRLRGADGSRDPRSSGTLIEKDGRTTSFGNADFTLTPGGKTFTSTNGAGYPIEWTLAVPAHKIELRVTTPLADQELWLKQSTGIAYWEGMIDVAGKSAGQVITGSGYLEMTGYHGNLGRVLSGR